MNIGIIGCGDIARKAYLPWFAKSSQLRTVAVADMDVARAQALGQQFGMRASGVDELLADPGVDLVVNLTTPQAHAPVGLKAIAAGKHHYCEKPFGLDRAEARTLVEAAAKRGLRLGCAPDTVLGGGTQTCRKLIDEGAIGQPVAAVAFMVGRGHEHWHPDPEFYYLAGGGPMFDMGPYYLTSLITLLGPVRRVTGSARATWDERTILSEKKRGKRIPVEIPTHVAAVLDFHGGAIATVIMSFDVFGGHSLPRIEVFGSEASLQVPDPNGFGGQVRIRRRDDKDWSDVALTHPYTEHCRGLGVQEMALAIHEGRPHRASGELAFHVLDVMQAVHEASATGRHVELTTTCAKPEAMPAAGLPAG